MPRKRGSARVSGNKQKVLDAMAADEELSLRASAEKLKVPPRLVRAWMEDPSFLAELEATEKVQRQALAHRRAVAESFGGGVGPRGGGKSAPAARKSAAPAGPAAATADRAGQAPAPGDEHDPYRPFTPQEMEALKREMRGEET